MTVHSHRLPQDKVKRQEMPPPKITMNTPFANSDRTLRRFGLGLGVLLLMLGVWHAQLRGTTCKSAQRSSASPASLVGITPKEDSLVAPFPPTGLTAELLGGGKVTLTWIDSPDPETQYYGVYRRATADDFQRIACVRSRGRTSQHRYNDRLQRRGRFEYYVTVVTSAESQPSERASVTWR